MNPLSRFCLALCLLLLHPIEAWGAKIVGCASDHSSISCRAFPGQAVLDPIGVTVDLGAGGGFRFESLPPGDYTVRILPSCVRDGCFAHTNVRIERQDETKVTTPVVLVPYCPGDCRGAWKVDVGDVVNCISRSLGEAGCRGCDRNADGEVSIEEIVDVVNSVMEGCDWDAVSDQEGFRGNYHEQEFALLNAPKHCSSTAALVTPIRPRLQLLT